VQEEMQLMGHWLDVVQVTEMLFEVVKCIPFKQVCFE
jgi:hypothetical protein